MMLVEVPACAAAVELLANEEEEEGVHPEVRIGQPVEAEEARCRAIEAALHQPEDSPAEA